MKYSVIVLLAIFLAGCGDKNYSEKELLDYKKSVDCEGYKRGESFLEISNPQRKKTAIQKCESDLFRKTDNIKPSPKKDY